LVRISVAGQVNDFKLHDEIMIWDYNKEVFVDDSFIVEVINEDVILQTIRVNFVVEWERKDQITYEPNVKRVELVSR